jgi:hypothetical protein
VGETVLMTAAMALPNGQAAEQAVRAPPAATAVHDLEELFRMKGCRVPVFELASVRPGQRRENSPTECTT